MKLATFLAISAALLLQPLCRARAATDPVGAGYSRASICPGSPVLRRSSTPQDQDPTQDAAFEPSAGWGEDNDDLDHLGLDPRTPIFARPTSLGPATDRRPPPDASRPAPRSPLLRC